MSCPATESQNSPTHPGLPPQHIQFLKSPMCHTSGNCPSPAVPGDRGRLPRRMILTTSGTPAEAVTQVLEKQWPGSGCDRRVVKGKGKVSPGSKAGDGLRDHIPLPRGLCCRRERHRLIKTPLAVKAANFSAAHQFLCRGRLVTDTHAHQHPSPPPGPVNTIWKHMTP